MGEYILLKLTSHLYTHPLFRLDIMNCPHSKLNASLDRLSECHWHIHQMETHYHTPDLFRYSFNSFLRAIKELPQIMTMELGKHERELYKSNLKPIIKALESDPLVSFIIKQRNFVVHQGMLSCLSTGTVGTTEGRGIKIGISFPVFPTETTIEAYQRFKLYCKRNKSFRNLCGPDCDSWPIIVRDWKIEDFPDINLLDLSINTWCLVGNTLSDILIILGADNLDLTFSCRHDIELVRKMEFNQADFFMEVDGIYINKLNNE